MLLYIIRHGDPIYDPDSLTPKGMLQAEALAKRLALYGVDRVYTSPLGRAKLTAEPTCKLLNLTAQTEDWTSEAEAGASFCVDNKDGTRTWVFHCHERTRLRSKSVRDRGLKWYEDQFFDNERFKKGYFRILDHSDEFLARHGYVHDRENCCYIPKSPNDERIAVFCHQGFGLSWIGALLDIPLPIIWSHTDITHSGVTVIDFSVNPDGMCVPKMLTMSNDSHIYREGLPTKYNNSIYF